MLYLISTITFILGVIIGRWSKGKKIIFQSSHPLTPLTQNPQSPATIIDLADVLDIDLGDTATTKN